MCLGVQRPAVAGVPVSVCPPTDRSAGQGVRGGLPAGGILHSCLTESQTEEDTQTAASGTVKHS